MATFGGIFDDIWAIFSNIWAIFDDIGVIFDDFGSYLVILSPCDIRAKISLNMAQVLQNMAQMSRNMVTFCVHYSVRYDIWVISLNQP